MKQLADITAAQLQEMGIVRQEELAIYRYGFDALFTALLQMASIFSLALVVGNFFETFLFFSRLYPTSHLRRRLPCRYTVKVLPALAGKLWLVFTGAACCSRRVLFPTHFVRLCFLWCDHFDLCAHCSCK